MTTVVRFDANPVDWAELDARLVDEPYSCPVGGCGEGKPREALVCRPHWRALPTATKTDVMTAWGAWRDGFEDLHALRAVQFAAVSCLHS